MPKAKKKAKKDAKAGKEAAKEPKERKSKTIAEPSLIDERLDKEAKREVEERKGQELLPQLSLVVEKSKKRVVCVFSHENVTSENSDEARDLYSQSRYGTILDGGKVQFSLLEALYLQEKGKITISDAKGKAISQDAFIAKAKKLEHNFWVKYCVYKDIRNRGYIIKTALKFGADFRVYDRGVKPGEDHARWVVFPIHEGQTLTWHDFAAKNRVAHSTKKRLMIGIVDAETDVTYYEIRWIRP